MNSNSPYNHGLSYISNFFEYVYFVSRDRGGGGAKIYCWVPDGTQMQDKG